LNKPFSERQPYEAAVGCWAKELSGGPTISDCRTVSACPFVEGNLGESRGITLATVDEAEDYQGQRPLGGVVSIHFA